MRVALIHDHLMQAGGAEKVLEVLAEMFPGAPIYTLMYDPAITEKYFPGRHIEASIIQRIPFGRKHYRWFMPLMPMAVEFFDLKNFDLVISSTSSFAKGVITTPDTLHICYCHTPTRYLWSDTHRYVEELHYPKEKIVYTDTIYNAPAEKLIPSIRSLDDHYNKVVIVGHNTGFTELANVLGNLDIANVPTCGIVALDFKINRWKDVKKKEGKFVFFYYPKMLKDE
jgi:hypothetical protein